MSSLVCKISPIASMSLSYYKQTRNVPAEFFTTEAPRTWKRKAKSTPCSPCLRGEFVAGCAAQWVTPSPRRPHHSFIVEQHAEQRHPHKKPLGGLAKIHGARIVIHRLVEFHGPRQWMQDHRVWPHSLQHGRVNGIAQGPGDRSPSFRPDSRLLDDIDLAHRSRSASVANRSARCATRSPYGIG